MATSENRGWVAPTAMQDVGSSDEDAEGSRFGNRRDNGNTNRAFGG